MTRFGSARPEEELQPQILNRLGNVTQGPSGKADLCVQMLKTYFAYKKVYVKLAHIKFFIYLCNVIR